LQPIEETTQRAVFHALEEIRPRRSSPATPAFRTTRLERDILKVLLYFDIFNHPLKAEELYSFLPSNSTSPSDILRACQSHPLKTIVSCRESYIFMKSAGESCIDERLRKEQLAARRWRIAGIMTKLIERFPFVRGVFVSGELSKGLASKHGDIHFVVVTREHRLWICRTLLILFKKTLLLNSKKYFCVNHFVAERHLGVASRNLYSATEVATLKALGNSDSFHKYTEANAWVAGYFPNLRWGADTTPTPGARASVLQKLIELAIPDKIGDRLDAWLMSRWMKLWNWRYAHLDKEKRSRLFRCSRFLSTAYGEDFQSKILSGYFLRLKQFGIEVDDAAATN
jgi:hypothetical protein